MKLFKLLPIKTLLVIVSFSLFAACYSVAKPTEVAPNSLIGKKTTEFLTLFYEAFLKVKKEYVSEISDKQLVEAAINGMLSSLDPHSGYMDEKSFEEMRQSTKGEFGGLGMEVTMENGLVKIVSPIEGTPAERAGIQAGDYIVGINDEPVYGLTLTEAVEKMRGKPGTNIRISVTRENLAEPLELDVTREIIKIKATRSKLFDNNIAYLRLNTFSENASEALTKEFNSQKEASGNKIKGVVLDLRNNPGGLLEEAVSVTDLFIEKGDIVFTKGRDNQVEQKFSATKGDITNGLPLVVLVNAGSASASEIVAGAIQDNKRGLIVGVKSFGKGSVQTVLPMSNGGAIKVTTSRYYTPSGRSIQAEGIIPDIYVEQAKIEKTKQSKLKIHESTLHKHLSNTELTAKLRANEEMKKINEVYEQDFQLARALDVVKAVGIFSNKLK